MKETEITMDGAIGFIGLGVMGEPMCRNLARGQPAPVIAFDVRSEPLARLRADGVEAADSVRAVAERSDTVLLSLPDGEAVRAVCLADDGLLAAAHDGQTIIDTSTSPPALARELHDAFAARNVDFADAPIARTRQAAIEGTLSIMVGGTPEVVARIRPILDCLANEVTHCGGTGAGQTVKILNNMVLFQNVVALSEALAIARRTGLDEHLLLDTLGKGSADSFALQNHGKKSLLPRSYPEEAFSVRYALKDLRYALELADQGGIAPHGAENVLVLFEAAIERGWGERYHPVIREVIEEA